jgi:hypothetical protein
MSHVTPEPLATSDTESGPPTTAGTPRKHAPVLITENQVAFSPISRRRGCLGRWTDSDGALLID